MRFNVSVYDTSPLYSIYSCDDLAYVGPFKEGVKTTQVEQALVNLNKPINQDYITTFNDILNRSSNHTNSPTRSLEDYLNFPFNTKNLSIVKSFTSIAKMLDEKKIEKILETDLNPEKISEKDIFGLVKYLELNHFNQMSEKKHYNIFGTGGDKKKTINISTIAAIFASHYDDTIIINKCGTLEVSSNVGSETFYNILCRELRKNTAPKSKYFNFNHENGSKYVRLSTFRYEYTDEIRTVREKIWKKGHNLDIFKIIFPVSNLSNSAAQINGVSSERYLRIYKRIYSKFNKCGIIIYNCNGIDEIMEGDNQIEFFLESGNVETYKFTLKKTNNSRELQQYWNYYSESTGLVHVERFFKFFNQPDFIKWTMAYNVALLIKLKYQDKQLDEIAINVFEWFKSINGI